MQRLCVCLLFTAVIGLFVNAKAENPVVIMDTSKGVIEIELDQQAAPITVENFLKYVDDGFYEGTIYHRVIKAFMIQGGGFTKNLVQKQTRDPIKNEGTNGLKNEKYTIAMARTPAPHSATAQFFINTKNNAFLNARPGEAGYAVFGKVISGKDVVDAIDVTPTRTIGQFQNFPVETVLIKSVKRKAPADNANGTEAAE